MCCAPRGPRPETRPRLVRLCGVVGSLLLPPAPDRGGALRLQATRLARCRRRQAARPASLFSRQGLCRTFSLLLLSGWLGRLHECHRDVVAAVVVPRRDRWPKIIFTFVSCVCAWGPGQQVCPVERRAGRGTPAQHCRRPGGRQQGQPVQLAAPRSHAQPGAAGGRGAAGVGERGSAGGVGHLAWLGLASKQALERLGAPPCTPPPPPTHPPPFPPKHRSGNKGLAGQTGGILLRLSPILGS